MICSVCKKEKTECLSDGDGNSLCRECIVCRCKNNSNWNCEECEECEPYIPYNVHNCKN